MVGISARTLRSELRIYDFREFLHLYGGPLEKMASTLSAHGNRRASQFSTVKLTVLLSELRLLKWWHVLLGKTDNSYHMVGNSPFT